MNPKQNNKSDESFHNEQNANKVIYEQSSSWKMTIPFFGKYYHVGTIALKDSTTVTANWIMTFCLQEVTTVL